MKRTYKKLNNLPILIQLSTIYVQVSSIKQLFKKIIQKQT